jgi:hypothetical protein
MKENRVSLQRMAEKRESEYEIPLCPSTGAHAWQKKSMGFDISGSICAGKTGQKKIAA